jgi:uncharacterized protein YecA (UPF0149 family)
MHLMPFYAVEPKLAADETWVMHLFSPHDEVPPGHYGMIEFYCPDRARRIGRNDPCPCGSGKKYKQCCGRDIGR